MASRNDYNALMANRALPFYLNSETPEVVPGGVLPYQTQAEADPYMQAAEAGKTLMQNVVDEISGKAEINRKLARAKLLMESGTIEKPIPFGTDLTNRVKTFGGSVYDKLVRPGVEGMERVGGAMLGKETYPPVDEINDPATIRLKQAQDVMDAVGLYAGPTIAAGGLGKPSATTLSALGAKGGEQAANKVAPLWRSQMADVLEQKLPGKAEPKQIESILNSLASPPDEITSRLGELTNKFSKFKKENGPPLTSDEVAELGKLKVEAAKYKGEFKAEELEWSGVKDWLSGKSGKVTKQEVTDYLAENNVKVEEVVKGEMNAVKAEKEYADFVDSMRAEAKNFYMDAAETESERETARRMGEKLSNREDVRSLAKVLGRELDLSARREAIAYSKQNMGTVFGQYQLPGGENYRELLLTLPEPKIDRFDAFDARMRKHFNLSPEEEGKLSARQRSEMRMKYVEETGDAVAGMKEDFRSTHYQEPNILAHVRFNERTDADGKRVLFIEEVQSDWAQKGRKEGFAGKDFDASKRDRLQAQWERFVDDGRNETPEAREVLRELQAENNKTFSSAVPDAPFVKDTGKWSMLAMKRMVRYAAENGFDRIAWTTGEQQAARYDLSKQVDSILYAKRDNGTYQLKATKSRGGDPQIIADSVDPKKLEDYVGKDVAQKIIDNAGDEVKHTRFRQLSGVDLKVGGEGMKGFYDKILPAEVNKFFNKGAWGNAKVGKVELPNRKGPFFVDDNQSNVSKWKEFASYKEAAKYADEIHGIVVNRDMSDIDFYNVHSLDITPQMKAKSIKEGMPLFSAAGAAGLCAYQQDKE